MCLCACMLALEWKGRAFIEKVNSRRFCWFLAAILVDSFCPPMWRPHTKLYKGVWYVSANNSETVGHKDLRFGQIVYILVFYNNSFSWLLSLDGFQFIFLCCVYWVTVKTKNIWPLIMRNIWIQGQENEWWRNGRKGKKSVAKDWILTPQLSKNKQSLGQENVAVKWKSSINKFELWK